MSYHINITIDGERALHASMKSPAAIGLPAESDAEATTPDLFTIVVETCLRSQTALPELQCNPKPAMQLLKSILEAGENGACYHVSADIGHEHNIYQRGDVKSYFEGAREQLQTLRFPEPETMSRETVAHIDPLDLFQKTKKGPTLYLDVQLG